MYTPITIHAAPHLKCYVLATLAVLPEYQRIGYSNRLMDAAEKHLNADVIFIMGEIHHYAKLCNIPHQVLTTGKSKRWTTL